MSVLQRLRRSSVAQRTRSCGLKATITFGAAVVAQRILSTWITSTGICIDMVRDLGSPTHALVTYFEMLLPHYLISLQHLNASGDRDSSVS